MRVAAIALTLVVGATWAQGGEERLTFDTESLEIRNLIGEFEVTPHAGSAFEVVVRVEGEDAAASPPRLVRDDDRLTIEFPDSKKFVYPRMGRGSKTRISNDSGDGWFSEMMDSLLGRDIKVSGSGSGLEVWADVEVHVPAGATLTVRHGVGRVNAEEVEGALTLEVRSGRVVVAGAYGDLSAETGSGGIDVERVEGRVELATGAGSIEARQIRGPGTSIATGSGRVEADGVDSTSVSIATGSGSIRARSVTADRASIATGSGSVLFELTGMGSGSFEIGTGSGSVTLRVPSDASMDVHAETGSGGIDLDMTAEMEMTRRERDEVEFTVGGGAARVRIGTGSGGIRIAQGSKTM
jgi:hypothetical protein